MDKIEVTQNARQAAFDAYLTCYEIVPNDLWLQALLDGKHDGDEMAQAFARFERDILATRTDATPVATDVAALVDALEWYRDQMCEGYCEGYDPRACAAFGPDKCAGCPAAVALAPFTKGQNDDAIR